jgi:DNA gyrase/topoisomerase IV subunit A
MKEQISELYGIYGKYINRFRAFPLTWDGLKIVERRILYSLYERAKEHYVKSAEIVGWVIGQYHPHGDQSAYGSLVSLVNGGMAIGQGNWGSTQGIVPCEAAAMRYTEVKSNPDILDMAFEFIKYVKREELELKEEPLFLPTKLPLCLVNTNYCQGIGFGSRTVIPSYKVSDLVRRLKWLLGYEKKEPIIRPLTDCLFLSTDKEFQQLLTTGQAKIDYRGICDTDYSNKSIIVRSLPPGRSFPSLLKKMEKDIQINKCIGFIDESTSKTKVRFSVIKRTMKLEILAKKIHTNITGSLTFECNMCDLDGNVILVSIDQMLLTVYKNYEQVVSVVLKTNIKKIQENIDELNLIDKIKKILPKWLKEYPDDADRVMAGVHQDTQIPFEKIKELFDKYTLSKILKIKTDIVELEQKKAELQGNLDNLSNYVWSSRYESLVTNN